jgi:hypothetical protein
MISSIPGVTPIFKLFRGGPTHPTPPSRHFNGSQGPASIASKTQTTTPISACFPRNVPSVAAGSTYGKNGRSESLRNHSRLGSGQAGRSIPGNAPRGSFRHPIGRSPSARIGCSTATTSGRALAIATCRTIKHHCVRRPVLPRGRGDHR